MCYHLKTHFGGTEAVIDDNCGISKFYSIAGTLSRELKVTFINQEDEADTLNWEFKYKKYFLKLTYNIFNGVSILPVQAVKVNLAKVNKIVEDIAQILVKRAY